MARGVNKVILVGNLGNDPEVRAMPSGATVAMISIATSESWKDKQTGLQQDRTEWHRICFYGRLAEIVGEYLKKGSKVYVEGSLRTRKWKDKNEVERQTTEIIANTLQMLDSKGTGASNAYGSSQSTNTGAAKASGPMEMDLEDFGMAEPVAAGDHSLDDDLPF